MSKLHFFIKRTKFPLEVAAGDGDISGSGDWPVTITSGEVKKGISYLVSQGQNPPTDWYPCLTGATKDGLATFGKTSAQLLTIAQAMHANSVLSVQAALAGVQKTVKIEIDLNDLRDLKDSNYRLCFAKKVAEGDYNVVWQSYAKFLTSNTFSWTPQYQLFGTNSFKDNVEVDVSTNMVDIGLGETSALDAAGILGDPKSGGTPTAITLVNNYGSIHPGVNQLSTGINGTQVSTPIYVAPKAMVSGSAELTPVESVLVWFEQNITTSTIFSTARSRSVEIDLTRGNSAARKYQDQKWITP